jgi:gas vesicle protein
MMGFVAGAVVGAGIALLMAPASGEETRRRLGDTARRMRQDAKNRMSQARETLEDLKEDARSAIQTGRETFSQGRRQRTESPNAPSSYSEPDATSRPL